MKNSVNPNSIAVTAEDIISQMLRIWQQNECMQIQEVDGAILASNRITIAEREDYLTFCQREVAFRFAESFIKDHAVLNTKLKEDSHTYSMGISLHLIPQEKLLNMLASIWNTAQANPDIPTKGNL